MAFSLLSENNFFIIVTDSVKDCAILITKCGAPAICLEKTIQYERYSAPIPTMFCDETLELDFFKRAWKIGSWIKEKGLKDVHISTNVYL